MEEMERRLAAVTEDEVLPASIGVSAMTIGVGRRCTGLLDQCIGLISTLVLCMGAIIA